MNLHDTFPYHYKRGIQKVFIEYSKTDGRNQQQSQACLVVLTLFYQHKVVSTFTTQTLFQQDAIFNTVTTLKTGLPELYTRQGKEYLLATTPATASGIYLAFPSFGTCTLSFI